MLRYLEEPVPPWGGITALILLWEIIFRPTQGLWWWDLLAITLCAVVWLLAKNGRMTRTHRLAAGLSLVFVLRHLLNSGPFRIIPGILENFGASIPMADLIQGLGSLLAAVGVGISLTFVTLSRFSLRDPEQPGREKEWGPFPFILDRHAQAVISTRTGTMHVQVTGATGSGKTHYFMKPVMAQSIEKGLGCFIYDVKSNLLPSVASCVEGSGRQDHFRFFDLGNPNHSMTYNPLVGPSSDEISNRLFTALYFKDEGEPYYREQAYAFLSHLIPLLRKEVPVLTFLDLDVAINQEIKAFQSIKHLCEKHPTLPQARYFQERWLSATQQERRKELSGLGAKISRFVGRDWSPLINCKKPDITMEQVMDRGEVFLFGVASMTNPEDAKPLALMAMMDLASQVGRRFQQYPDKPFDVYLDEFYNLAYPGFTDLLNKAREAKVRLILAHQSLGDLEGVSHEFADQVLTNTQSKVIFRSDHPPTAEYFARMIGTEQAAPRRTYSFDTRGGFFGGTKAAGYTEVVQDEFRVHPNEIKELRPGQAIVRTVVGEGEVTQAKVSLRPAPMIPAGFDHFLLAPRRNKNKEPLESTLPFSHPHAASLSEGTPVQGEGEEEKDELAGRLHSANLASRRSRLGRPVSSEGNAGPQPES